MAATPLCSEVQATSPLGILVVPALALPRFPLDLPKNPSCPAVLVLSSSAAAPPLLLCCTVIAMAWDPPLPQKDRDRVLLFGHLRSGRGPVGRPRRART